MSDIHGGDIFWEVKADLSQFNAGMSQVSQQAQMTTQELLGHAAVAGRGLAVMGGLMVAPLAIGVKKAMDFEQAIANAASVTGKSGDEFIQARDKMNELAMTLGRETVFSASEAANAFYDLSSKGFDVATMSVEELKPILDLAAATQADLTFATETTTSVLRAFGLENQDTTRIADVFTKAIGSSAASIDKLSQSMTYVAPVAKAGNVSLEETTAVLAQLYDAGLQGSMAGTALRGVLMELMSPSDKLTTALDKVGLSVEDVDLNTKSLTEVLQTLRDSGLDSADMLDIFGARAGPASLILLETADAAEELTGSLQDAGGSAAQVAEQQLDTLAGQLKLLGSAFESLIIPIGQALIPALRKLIDIVRPLIAWLAELAQKHQGWTTAIVVLVGAIGGLALVCGTLLMVFGPMVKTFIALKALLAFFGVGGGIASASAGIAGVGAAGAGASVGVGAFAVSLGAAALAIAPVIVALVILAPLFAAVKQEARGLREANEELARSEKQLEEKNREYIRSLEERGAIVDENKMKDMSWAQQRHYLADREKAEMDTLLVAHLDHYLQREANEQEYAQARNLVLNEWLSEEEAAILVSLDLSEQRLMEIMRMDQEETDAALHELNVRGTESIRTDHEITESARLSAAIRKNEWNDNAQELLEIERETAERAQSIWGRFADWFRGMFRGLWNQARRLIGLASEAGAINAAPSPSPEGGDVPSFSSGGIAGPGFFEAGEAGKELIYSDHPVRVLSAMDTRDLLRTRAGGDLLDREGNVVVNVNVDAKGIDDPNVLSTILATQIKRELRSAGVWT